MPGLRLVMVDRLLELFGCGLVVFGAEVNHTKREVGFLLVGIDFDRLLEVFDRFLVLEPEKRRRCRESVRLRRSWDRLRRRVSRERRRHLRAQGDEQPCRGRAAFGVCWSALMAAWKSVRARSAWFSSRRALPRPTRARTLLGSLSSTLRKSSTAASYCLRPTSTCRGRCKLLRGRQRLRAKRRVRRRWPGRYKQNRRL